MHTALKPILFSFIASAALGQHPCTADTPQETVRIHKLIVESNTLPQVDRERLTHLLEQKSYPRPEIADRVEMALRDHGYFKAVIRDSDVSFAPQAGNKAVDVTVKVEPGPQYRLGEIRFDNGTVFSSNQLRQLLPLQEGDLFNTTQFSKSLDALRKLYGTRGYIDTVVNPVPEIDDRHHIIDLVLSIDEGKPYNFGQLSLEGAEPHAGAAKALMASWKPLEGRPYNSLELQKWFDANRATWHAGPESWKAISSSQQPEFHAVNITLKQPCW
jgi:outer membrane translocation and assembly module TamA